MPGLRKLFRGSNAASRGDLEPVLLRPHAPQKDSGDVRIKQEKQNDSTSRVLRKRAKDPSSFKQGVNYGSELPPKVELQLSRRHSPRLVDLDGYSSTPWVDLGSSVSSNSSLGLGGSKETTGRSGRVDPRLKATLDNARLTPEQVTLLIIACTKVIREQGTLNILQLV